MPARPTKPEAANPAVTKRPRGRPPLPEDNETRESLLNAAQKLFSKRSFTQVNVREITDTAGVSLSAINYHFGSKDELIYALARRTGPQLIRERAELLREAEALGGTDVEPRLRAILYALLAPVIRWYRKPNTQKFYVPFQQRARLDGPPRVRELLRQDTAHLQPFVLALSRLLPELSPQEIGWRLHFVLGIEHAVIMEPDRLAVLSGGLSKTESDETVIERVIEFVRQGLLAPPQFTATPAAPAAAKPARKKAR